MENPRFAVLKKASFYTMPFSLNLSSGPLSNLDVRKALNYGVDKDSLIRYDLLGNGQPIATVSMPGEVGYNSSLKPYEFDPEKAKQLLAKAGYSGGLSMEFLVKKNVERAARIIAANLKKIGITLHITLVSDADMIREFRSGKYDMFIGSCPDPMCHSYFTQSIVFFSKSPFAWGGDAKFDDMLMTMVATVGPEESKKKAEAIDKYIYDNAMSVFTYQKTSVLGLVKNLFFMPYVSGMPYFFSAEFKGAQ
jgi:peptide/nickel transport system substrate-binding protein